MSTFVLKGDACRLPFANQSVDLVFGSPPYLEARTYNDGTLPAGHVVSRQCLEWVEWMLAVTAEACRVSRGLVLWVVAGSTDERCYQPGPEMLLAEWWRRGGQCWRPAYWHRNTIPGGGGKHWLRGDVEYVLCFKGSWEWPAWTNNTACGHPPRWAPGGEMSHRVSDGKRVNAFGVRRDGVRIGARRGQDDHMAATETPDHASRDIVTGKPSPVTPASMDLFGEPAVAEAETPANVNHLWDKGGYTRSKDGKPKPGHGRPKGVKRGATSGYANGDTKNDGEYTPPVLANPGNLLVDAQPGESAPFGYTVHAGVGGGQMGNAVAHANEAPFPEALVEFFLLGWCPPGGLVLDPFGGSGTTATVAARLQRHAVSLDLRSSQCELAMRRLDGVQIDLFGAITAPAKEVST